MRASGIGGLVIDRLRAINPGRRRAPWLAGVAALVASLVLAARVVDPDLVADALRAAGSSPVAAVAVLAAYSSAFVVRAWAWRRVLPALSFGHALAALHLSLGANHVLPLRLGEALRVTSAVRRAGVSLSSATASTVMLRGADILAVVLLAAAFGPVVASAVIGPWAWALALPVACVAVAGVWWLRRLRLTGRSDVRTPVGVVAGCAVAAWLLESAVMWQAGRWAGVDLTLADAVLVTAVTIAAQIVAITPGGIGTYEGAATAALVATGADATGALATAITAHALKTAYALVTGGVSAFVPQPSALGRLRLPPGPPRGSNGHPSPDAIRRERARQDAPVVLFLPAHDEAPTVGNLVERSPKAIGRHPVVVLVVDDGSTDRTAEVAALSGARVIRLPHNRGLGAAVRRGLQEAVALDPAAVAFCDADGEYAPEELEQMVEPILAGRSDYVVGSRFAGRIGRMLPHRRLGNRVLTRFLRFIARRPIGDGQSGFRAFGPAAARDAEVIHDFNYAQILTLDLVAKGYRYEEVPISYSFRTDGRSFVRLLPYLRAVVPAVYRELNT